MTLRRGAISTGSRAITSSAWPAATIRSPTVEPRAIERPAGRSLRVREVLPAAQMIEPQAGELFLDAVLPQSGREVREVDPIHLLVLVDAREDDRLHAGDGIDVLLEALRADFLHHALHR